MDDALHSTLAGWTNFYLFLLPAAAYDSVLLADTVTYFTVTLMRRSRAGETGPATDEAPSASTSPTGVE